MLTCLAIENYRSLRELLVPLDRLNVITGSNGSGKSSIYRALRLLAQTAQDGVVQALAREGGLQSTLWAGPEALGAKQRSGIAPIQGTARKKRTSLKMGFGSDDFSYAIDLGLPTQVPGPPTSAFQLDPEIKRESIWHGPVLRPATALVERTGPLTQVRHEDGSWNDLSHHVAGYDSILARCGDPKEAPELMALRETIRSWRFYDHFRTDVDSPARQPQVGTHTPVLANDGNDLGAAWQTIRESGDADALEESVEDAFPGGSINIDINLGRFSVSMIQHGLLRPLEASELSDGTLRYLLLIAALLSPRPPTLLVLNEPETSLHPQLLPALGRLIARAAETTQLIVVSHAEPLIASLFEATDCNSIQLQKTLGETTIANFETLNAPSWKWPKR